MKLQLSPSFVIPLVSTLLKVLCKTLRVTLINQEVEQSLRAKGGGIIYTSWHGRILYFIYHYRNLQASVLVSQSRDGELLTTFLRSFNFQAIRGSSSKGGREAFKALVSILKEGNHVGIIPDGPRGPRYVVQEGIIRLAHLTGAPILPLAYGARRKKTVSSWDRCLIPYPFTKVVVIYGEPIYVSRVADHSALEGKRAELEVALKRITERADRLAEVES
ncbi:MAG: lysophospholipid acyltransferase family protein [Candidatus Tectomicrobia bacterium]|nr:lysophospholipid acyltransferase family protein [Candidatus Tectomicrobia bacterium]